MVRDHQIMYSFATHNRKSAPKFTADRDVLDLNGVTSNTIGSGVVYITLRRLGVNKPIKGVDCFLGLDEYLTFPVKASLLIIEGGE